MISQDFLSLLVSLLMLAIVWLYQYSRSHRGPFTSLAARRSLLLPRRLKPRSPLDCPACCLASSPSSGGEPAPAPVRPWKEIRSRRGAPKRMQTEGFACPNQACQYYGISDANIHALVGDGVRGQAERIQRWRSQACRTTFTARRHTPLYRLKTPSQQIGVVLTARAFGLDPSAAERIFGYRQATITSLSVPRWRACSDLARALTSRILHLGPRTQSAAHTVIHSLRQILAAFLSPALHQRWSRLVLVCADGPLWTVAHGGSPRAESTPVAGGGGFDLRPGEKNYRRRKLVRVTPVMRLGTSAALTATLQGLGLSGRVNTAFIERMNLTVRHGVAALARRTWATAQQAPPLLAHLEWWRIASPNLTRGVAQLAVVRICWWTFSGNWRE
jgi:hypothetical protein